MGAFRMECKGWALPCLALLCIVFAASAEVAEYDQMRWEDEARISEIEFAQTTDDDAATAAPAAKKAKAPAKAAAKPVKKPAKAKKKPVKKAKKATKKPAGKRHYTAKKLFVPNFVGKKAWANANKKQKLAYEKANKYYMKVNGKKFKAQNEKEEKLNAKASKAQQVLYKAKEGMRKKYARDNPADYPPGMPKAVEKRHKARIQGDGRNESGSYGASGCNPHDPKCKPKWYPDGAISSNAYTDKRGRYFLGTNRRRIGAGFGRRRAEKWRGRVSKDLKKSYSHGHDLLKAMISRHSFGEKKGYSSRSFDKSHFDKGEPLLQAAKHKRKTREIAIKIMRERAVKKSEKGKKKAPKGHHILDGADEKKLGEKDKNALRATGAGVTAIVDKNGRFHANTVVKILGKSMAKVLGKKVKGEKKTKKALPQKKAVSTSGAAASKMAASKAKAKYIATGRRRRRGTARRRRGTARRRRRTAKFFFRRRR